MIFILPLQLRPSLGLQILEWHGYPNVNYGYGVFHQDFLPLAEIWFAQHLPKVPAEIGSFDVVSLQDMPDTMDGYAHPLKTHFNMKAASRSYAMELYADYDALYASKRSSESRRSSRKRDTKLAGPGTLSFRLPETKLEAHRILEDMFEHQAQRLAEFGVHGVLGVTEKEFVHLLADEQNEGHSFLLPYALKCDGRTWLHNAYINPFASYGWLGGISYFLLMISTITIGFKTELMRTPWQNWAIVVFCPLPATIFQGVQIDTDHWRHFYWMLGMMWGLFAASTAYTQKQT